MRQGYENICHILSQLLTKVGYLCTFFLISVNAQLGSPNLLFYFVGYLWEEVSEFILVLLSEVGDKRSL